MTKEEATLILDHARPQTAEIDRRFYDDEDLNNALDMAIKALEQEPCEDVVAIHTQGLDEGIRCAMCTNSMKSNRGCDGGCVVNEGMYREVMNTIEKHIVPSVTPTHKVGKWNKGVKPSGLRVYICSNCGSYYPLPDGLNFCPNCGADMRGNNND